MQFEKLQKIILQNWLEEFCAMNEFINSGNKDNFIHPDLVCNEQGVVYNGGEETWDRNTLLLRLNKSSIFSRRTCTIANILSEYDLKDSILGLTIAVLFELFTFGSEKSGWYSFIESLKLIELNDLAIVDSHQQYHGKCGFERRLFRQYKEFCHFTETDYNLVSPWSKFNDMNKFIQLINKLKSTMVLIDSYNEFGLIPYFKELTNIQKKITPDTYFNSVFITIKEVCFVCGGLDCNCQFEDDDKNDDDEEESENSDDYSDLEDASGEAQTINQIIEQEEKEEAEENQYENNDKDSDMETHDNDNDEKGEEDADAEDAAEDADEENFPECIKVLASNEVFPKERVLMAISENSEDSLAICPVHYFEEAKKPYKKNTNANNSEKQNDEKECAPKEKKQKIEDNKKYDTEDNKDEENILNDTSLNDEEYYITVDGNISNELILKCIKSMKHYPQLLEKNNIDGTSSNLDDILLTLYQLDSNVRDRLKNPIRTILLFNLKMKGIFSTEQYKILQNALYKLYN